LYKLLLLYIYIYIIKFYIYKIKNLLIAVIYTYVSLYETRNVYGWFIKEEWIDYKKNKIIKIIERYLNIKWKDKNSLWHTNI